MKAYIANDCSGKGHFGCTLVMETYREQFERVGIEEVMDPDKADLVIVNGEGSLHHGLRTDLIEWGADYPAVFVNGVYDSNPYDDGMTEFLYVAVRESLSAAELEKQGLQAEIVPSIILTSKRVNALKWGYPFFYESRITDNTRSTKSGHSAISDPEEYLSWLKSGRRAICGRFHAAVCCMVMEMPFTTWDSNTHKIRGLMLDAGVHHLHFETQKEAMFDLEKTEIEASIRTYVEDGKAKVNEMFELLAGGPLV